MSKRKPKQPGRTFGDFLADVIDPLRPPGSPPIEEVVHVSRFERYYPIEGEQSVERREVLWRRPK